jgi:hypothetical protein
MTLLPLESDIGMRLRDEGGRCKRSADGRRCVKGSHKRPKAARSGAIEHRGWCEVPKLPLDGTLDSQLVPHDGPICAVCRLYKCDTPVGGDNERILYLQRWRNRRGAVPARAISR